MLQVLAHLVKRKATLERGRLALPRRWPPLLRLRRNQLTPRLPQHPHRRRNQHQHQLKHQQPKQQQQHQAPPPRPSLLSLDEEVPRQLLRENPPQPLPPLSSSMAREPLTLPGQCPPGLDSAPSRPCLLRRLQHRRTPLPSQLVRSNLFYTPARPLLRLRGGKHMRRAWWRPTCSVVSNILQP